MADSLKIEETLYPYGNGYVKVVQLAIDFEVPFRNRGQIITSATIESSDLAKRAFDTAFTRNGKQFIAYFTLDGFSTAVASSIVKVYIDNTIEMMVFEDVDLTTIESLDSYIIPGTHPDGDDIWLSNF